MKATVWYKEGEFEVTEELMEEMKRENEKYNGKYQILVVSAEWKDGHLHFYQEGPFEC